MEAKKQSAVLIVEDEPASLNLLASYFTAENYLVYKANSSAQAEKLFSEKVIDIILMDIKIFTLWSLFGHTQHLEEVQIHWLASTWTQFVQNK